MVINIWIAGVSLITNGVLFSMYVWFLQTRQFWPNFHLSLINFLYKLVWDWMSSK
jgi:hypothetical protein